MSIYKEALDDKTIAAKILLPLIEFEFGFKGLDSPELVQCEDNLQQLESVFRICKRHNWTTSEEIRKKGKNFYLRISKSGFIEIYNIAGPFSDKHRNEWTKLITERSGKKGGYQCNKPKTEERISLLLTKQKQWASVEEICLKLRLLPSVVREALRVLHKRNTVERKRSGKTILWRYR